MSLSAELYEAVKRSLAEIPTDETADIYAISFLVYDDGDDPRTPTLTLGYNTSAQWQDSIDQASTSGEARWNYAFWLQNRRLCFGEPGSESAGRVRQWIESAGLWYSDEEEDADFDACLSKAEEITARFVRACCDAALQLHEGGDVVRIFGKAIPMIVHELEYYEEIVAQNEACNPAAVISEFAHWVRTEG